ncbi:MAG: LemA family protein [Clostridia bacterium]
MIYIFVAVVFILLIYMLISYNALVKSNNTVKEAFATMDVYLKKRWDLIPNIVETVKAYANHEKDTLNELTQIRSNTYDKLSNDNKIDTNEKLDSGISKIMMVAENYPDLKANQNFLDLSEKLTRVEEDIANSRKYFNAVVKMFNNKVLMFPSNIIAKIFGYKEKKMFEANMNEKENVNINL